MLRVAREGNVSFICKFCNHRCQSIKGHLFHLRNHRHLSKYFFCGYGHCSSSFQSEMALRCHVIRNHRMYVAHTAKPSSTPLNVRGKYQCPVRCCGEEFLIHRSFISHLKSHLRSGTSIPCPHSDCTNVFEKWSSLTGHISRKHRTRGAPSQPPDGELRFVLDLPTEDSANDEDPAPESICDEPPSSETNSLNDSVVALAQFYQRLEYKHMVPASVTQIVADELKTCCVNIESNFLTNLASTLESEGLPPETISHILISMSFKCDMKQTCRSLRSTYMRKNFYQDNFCFVEPVCVPLSKGGFFYYVPIEETIKAAYKNVSWSMFINQGFSSSSDGLLRDFQDGEMYKNNRFSQENPSQIPIILYQDGFQLVNPLGPAKNLKHKVLGIYMAFGNLPAEIRFDKDSIQLVGIVRECEFDHEEVYGLIVSDILKLQESGVNIPNVGNFKIYLAFISGDNLSSHSLGGFVENFSRSHYFCRYCLLTRKSFCGASGEIRKFQKRTPENYNSALSKVKTCPTTGIIKSYQGIKFDSEFNQLKGFHVCAPGLPPCLGHDLFEGIVAYDLKLFTVYFISKGWFELDELNMLIDKFPFSVEDRKDRPPPIKILKKARLAGGAWQLYTFLRLFPLIVFGHINDFDDPVWKCLLMLKSIAEICVAPEIHVSHLPSLQWLIEEYLITRLELFPTVPLRPKHHYLMHYCELFILYGPLIRVWTLRFESKHTFFTRSWRSSNNSINILQTLAFKHEYFQSWFRSGGGVRFESEYSKRSPFIPSIYSEDILSILRKNVPTLQLEECDRVKIKGTLYQKGNVLILKKMDMGTLIQVGTIHLILIDSDENVQFLVRCGTASFVHSYGSFMLNSASHFDCIKPQDLQSFYPLTPYIRDTVKFLSLRHALVSDNMDAN